MYIHTAAHHTSLQGHEPHELPIRMSKPGAKSETESGVVNDVGTPDTTGTEQPSSLPPESLSRSALNRFPPQPAPSLVSGGASVNLISNPHLVGSEGLDVDDGSCKEMTLESDSSKVSTHSEELVGHKRTTSTVAAEDTPVPDSSGTINTIAQPQGINPGSSCMFTVGSGMEQAEVENGEEGQPDAQSRALTQSHLARQSQSKQDIAVAYQSVLDSTNNVVQLCTMELNKQIEQLKKQIETLEQDLSEVKKEKEALQEENERLSDDLARYQTKAKEKEEAANRELQDITRQLEDCRRLVSEKEKEKDLAKLKSEEKCRQLQEEINIKQNEIESIKKDNELHTLRLQLRLAETEKSLEKKEKEICVNKVDIANQQVKIEKLERQREADIAQAKICKLEKENMKLKEDKHVRRMNSGNDQFSKKENECPERSSSDYVLQVLPH